MFSSRTPADLTPNRLAGALAAARAEGRSILDLTESNPTRAGFEYPRDLLLPLGQPAALRYAPAPFGLAEARRAVAGDYARTGVEVPPERIVLTASTSEAYACLFKLLADAGDDVLVPAPSYPLFDYLARLDQIEARPYALDGDRGWRIDFDSLERALTPRTRAILVVSPNNPTGTFLKADEAERLAFIAARGDVALIVDEVFHDYRFAAASNDPVARLVGRGDVLSFSLGGLSKSAGLPQVKLAWIAASGPSALVSAALERLELICDTYLSVSTPVQAAAAELLARGAAVRTQIASRVGRNYRVLGNELASTPACRLSPAEGGWYGVVRVPSFEPEETLVLRLLETDGVLVHPGYFFDFPNESFVVVSLIVPEAQFDEGVGRVLRRVVCPELRT
jgi:aspartate/methionine/tyrosine aminotransferase